MPKIFVKTANRIDWYPQTIARLAKSSVCTSNTTPPILSCGMAMA